MDSHKKLTKIRSKSNKTHKLKLDYTCRARWPEGLLCSTISLKSCNLAQILQSPKSEIVTCVMFSTHTNTSLIKPHLTELDEIHRNRPKSNYNLAKNLQSWSVTSDIRQTDTQRTEIHTFFIWYPRVGREHNSPSGNKGKLDLLRSRVSFRALLRTMFNNK